MTIRQYETTYGYRRTLEEDAVLLNLRPAQMEQESKQAFECSRIPQAGCQAKEMVRVKGEKYGLMVKP